MSDNGPIAVTFEKIAVVFGKLYVAVASLSDSNACDVD